MSRVRALFLAVIIITVILAGGCSDYQDTNININSEKNEQLIVHYIDVGQADSILIQLPNGEVSLIDGGNREDANYIIDYLEKQKIYKIDYLIATHPHEDHIGGLPDIIRTFDIGKIYMPKKSANTKIFEELLNEIDKKGLKITAPRSSENIMYSNDLKFTILGPNSDSYDETNNYSIVSKLVFKNTSFLFTGDAEKESELEILEKGYDIKADVLKVGHHGGRTSTSVEFLERVKPQYAVISVGSDNDYEHPHNEVLDRLEKLNITVFRTDKNGTIKVVSDGENIEFKCQNENNNIISKDNNENVYYIGNKNTKVYHSPDCGNLPEKENQILFKSKEEAEKAGYRPHERCVE